MKRIQFLNFTTDVAFKALLTKSKKLCANMLRDVVPDFRNKKVEVVEYLSTELPNTGDDKIKRSSLDVVAKLDNDRHADIEMQCLWHEGLEERMLLYLCQLFVNIVKKGTSSKDIKPVYLVLFTRFVLFERLKKICNAFGFRADEDNQVIFSDKMRIVTVELPKLDTSKPVETFDNVEQWSYLIGEAHKVEESEVNKLAQLRPEMNEAVKHAAEVSDDVALRLEAISREKNEMIALEVRRQGIEEAAEQGLKQGMQQGLQRGIRQGVQQGLQQGIQKGIQKGLQQGLQQGREEAKRQKYEMARRMLADGEPVAKICKFTGLSKDELRKL